MQAVTEFIKSSRLNPTNKAIFSVPPVSYNEMLPGLFWIPKEGDKPKLPCTLHCPPDLDTSPYIIIYCHSFSTDLGRSVSTLEALTKHLGIYIIAFEYSGYGLATEDNINPSEQSTTRDIMTVFDYVREKLLWPAERILLYGRALGCGVATTCARIADEKGFQVMALCLESSFTCLRDLSFCTYGLLGAIVINRFNIQEDIQHINCPLFLVHGKKDAYIPYGMSVTLMEEYKRHEIKQFHAAVNSGHNDLLEKNDIAIPLTHFISQIEQERQSHNIIIPNIPKHDYHAWLRSMKELEL